MSTEHDWQRLCPEGDVTARRMLALTFDDLPLVVFRDEHGQARALLDRCPHRGVPLSIGKVCRGRVTCCYHGWVFDGDGMCHAIPSNVEPMEPKPIATSFDTKEEGGFVWIQTKPPAT